MYNKGYLAYVSIEGTHEREKETTRKMPLKEMKEKEGITQSFPLHELCQRIESRNCGRISMDTTHNTVSTTQLEVS